MGRAGLSDHSSLLLNWVEAEAEDEGGPRPFRFLNRVSDAESRVDEAEMEYDLDPSPAHREHLHQDLLSAPTQTAGPISPDIIPSLITQEDNQELNRHPSLPKVREAVFSIDADSVAGSDGFSSHFFQQCWEIVQDDVFRAVLDFFDGGHLPRGFSATSIVLLPKRDNACRWTEFRSISLCTVFNKIITKLLNSRLSSILPLIISPQQSGFIQGRLIGDNILLALEMLHTLDTQGP
ncbi:Uncharacterized protein Adt_18149 [Abeliophyllum distichum]|uniref:Reverse transcriptase domain-containing protein n=1 Tax=Abeliophyllum distichum TaxID=126358 RepID=A0ABD1TIK7_9LAMI